MVSDATIDSFKKDGYLLIPGFVSKEDINQLRSTIQPYFENGSWSKYQFNTKHVINNVYETFPEIINLIINKELINVLSKIFNSKPVLLPETTIHYNIYTSWHKDTTTQEKMGHMFQWKPNALMVEAGIYLQDNDEYGGGLTVMPGSQKDPDYFKDINLSEPTLINKIKKKLALYNERSDKVVNPYNRDIFDIPSKAGDLVIFNFLTNHRASLPIGYKTEEIPFSKKKLAIFNAFSIDNETCNEYYNFILSRKEPFYSNLKNRGVLPALKTKAEELNFKIY
ncbi:MAG: phytanoyl-CoA dioxygenase family protein [Bacteroidetes bacterium]|nr:phytanoyl-CoA dioxygenase family protein [Bacteroidota bacterium]